MRVLKERPPNYDEIVSVFPVVTTMQGVLYAYCDAIYNPDWVDIPQSLLAHEQVHLQRQSANPAGWWTRYLIDEKFRFDEELTAHCVEWATIKNEPGPDRNYRRASLNMIAKRLSSPLYGSMVCFDTARKMIRDGAK